MEKKLKKVKIRKAKEKKKKSKKKEKKNVPHGKFTSKLLSITRLLRSQIWQETYYPGLLLDL